MMGEITREIIDFIPLLVAIPMLYLVVMASGQQILRQSANDPQIAMSEELSHALAEGHAVSIMIPSGIINLENSVSPFVEIFDASGRPISSTARLGGEVPVLTQGMFAYTLSHGEDRVTWQPENGVRIAAVLNYFRGKQEGFVLVGRSLRDTEIREDNLFSQVFLGWLGTVIMAFALSVILSDKKKRD